MTTDELCELLANVRRVQKLADAATEGPWYCVSGDDGYENVVSYKKHTHIGSLWVNAAAFVADSRTSVPLLCEGIVSLARDRLITFNIEIELLNALIPATKRQPQMQEILANKERLKAALDQLTDGGKQ